MASWLYWLRRPDRKLTSLDLFREIYGGRTSATGQVITYQRALECSTVLACCKVIAEGLAQVPWKLFVDKGKDIRNAQNDHSLYWLIYRRPNRWQNSFEFRETIAFHLVLTGNAYVFAGRVGSKREIRELVPLEPQSITVERLDDGALRYHYRPLQGQAVTFSADSIWHIRGPSWNTWMGLDGTKLAREAIGLAIAAESAHADFHKSGARVAGTYSVDGPLSAEKYKFLSDWLDKYAMGGERAGRPMILDMGAKWLAQQMTGVDAQHLETRKHQIEEICRAFRVMPIMIGFSDKTATYASAEQMFIAHVVHTLSPWYERIEQSADVNLLSEEEQAAGYYTKFIPNALMRGAAKDRAEYYAKALGSGGSQGWMTANEVRALEEMNSHSDGDKLPAPSGAAVPKKQESE
jgi:HK97 family phage portal protein